MTELARGIARALEEQAVHHRARADSRADEDGDEALGSPPHPESVLAPGRRAHVVLHVGGQAERGFDLVTKGDIVPLEIGREDDSLGHGMNLPGGGDPDAGHPRGVGRVEQPADDALEIGEDTGRALPGLGLHFEAAEKLALPAEETAAQLAPAEVDADGTPIGGHEQSRGGV